MSKFDPKDIQRHIREDTRRKPPPDENRIKEARDLNAKNSELLANATWEEIDRQLNLVGLKSGMPDYERIRQKWKDVQREIQRRLRSF